MKAASYSHNAFLEPGAGAYRITDQEFRLFQDLVQGETGIQLPESKRLLLVARLARRLRALKLERFADYYDRVMRDAQERIRMIDHLSTNETHFFREPKQFEFLERSLLPAWAAAADPAGRRHIRVWSAACSTGEEPFSIAMTLLSRLPGWEIEVFATDLSTRVLDRAQTAIWPIEKSRDIPERYLKAFMLRGSGDQQGYMKAGPELRAVVRFERLNLHGPHQELSGQFDLIFCRNVLIYFSAEGRAAVVQRLLQRLGPRGHLFLGHAETLNGITDRLRCVGPTAYRWAAATVPASTALRRQERTGAPGSEANEAIEKAPGANLASLGVACDRPCNGQHKQFMATSNGGSR